MGLEVATYISSLVSTNPVGASDGLNTADDHLRLIKAVLKASFPNINGAVTATPTVLNYSVGVTSAIQTQLNAKLASASYTAADVLTKIKTVDGSGSGLDADLLDGLSSAAFLGVNDTAVLADALSSAFGTGPSYAARAFAAVTSAGSLSAGGNLSVTKIDTGIYKLTFSQALSDANYSPIATAQHIHGNFGIDAMICDSTTASGFSLSPKTTTYFVIQTTNEGGAVDANFSVVVFR